MCWCCWQNQNIKISKLESGRPPWFYIQGGPVVCHWCSSSRLYIRFELDDGLLVLCSWSEVETNLAHYLHSRFLPVRSKLRRSILRSIARYLSPRIYILHHLDSPSARRDGSLTISLTRNTTLMKFVRDLPNPWAGYRSSCNVPQPTPTTFPVPWDSRTPRFGIQPYWLIVHRSNHWHGMSRRMETFCVYTPDATICTCLSISGQEFTRWWFVLQCSRESYSVLIWRNGIESFAWDVNTSQP